jgi:C1A family cysteine protease
MTLNPALYLYSYAANFKAIKYARLDSAGQGGAQTLACVKEALSGGHVVAFGFPVYSSIYNTGSDGWIPFPDNADTMVGGHAVLAVGFDDARSAGGDTGALIIRNSWSSAWGDQGYGYLPYRYVTEQLALDFWSITNSDWVPDSEFDE